MTKDHNTDCFHMMMAHIATDAYCVSTGPPSGAIFSANPGWFHKIKESNSRITGRQKADTDRL